MSIESAGLRGKRVLIVEGASPIPFALYSALERLGAEVMGPVGLLEDVALLIDQNRPDCVIVDGRLRGDARKAVDCLLGRLHVPQVGTCRRRVSEEAQNIDVSRLGADTRVVMLGEALVA